MSVAPAYTFGQYIRKGPPANIPAHENIVLWMPALAQAILNLFPVTTGDVSLLQVSTATRRSASWVMNCKYSALTGVVLVRV